MNPAWQALWATEAAQDGEANAWVTPPEVFGDLATRWGTPCLDAAASARSTQCPVYYGLDGGDGCLGDARLRQWGTDAWAAWRARPALDQDEGQDRPVVWLNPPYGRGIGAWLYGATEQAKTGNVDVIVLTFARTDTAWFQDYALPFEVLLYRGRLKFLHPETFEALSSAPAPSCAIRIRPCALPHPYLYGARRPARG